MSFLSGILKGVGTIFPPAGFVGGALDARDARKASKNALNISNLASDREYQRQKEFAQNQIRWRVDDAKAAGLHPLFALGQSSASYSPSTFIPGQSETGSFSSDGMGAALSSALTSKSPAQKRLTDAQIRKLEAEASLAETQALNAKRRIAEQPGNVAAVEPNAWQAPVGPKVSAADVAGPGALVPRVQMRLPSGRLAPVFNPNQFDELSQVDAFVTLLNDRLLHALSDREYYRRIRPPSRPRRNPPPVNVTEDRESKFWDY